MSVFAAQITKCHIVGMDPVTLGERLKTLREARGLTQHELASQVGRVQPEIYRWEKGRVRIPANDLPALAHALQVPLEAFFPDDFPSASGIDWELQLASRHLSGEIRQHFLALMRSMPRALPLPSPTDSDYDDLFNSN